MASIREELCAYGRKIADKGLVAGAGGNISAREGSLIWMKPSGFAMDELSPDDLAGVDIATGKVVEGRTKPTSEVNMHLAVYRLRPEVNAVFHTHSPWASGVLAATGEEMKPMFAEFINDLGVVSTLPYLPPTTQKLADAVAGVAEKSDTIFLRNHGVVAMGEVMKQAYYRVLVVEDAAKSLVAAKIMGAPVYLTLEQQNELMKLDAAAHRVNMMKK